MKPAHALALLLIPVLAAGFTVLAIWSRRVRDVLFFLIITLTAFAERLDVNFFSHAWYRGTTRGVEISLLQILAFALLAGSLFGSRSERPRWFWPGSLGVILLYLVYAGISVIISEPQLFGAFELTKVVGGILLFLASAAYVRSKHEWTILIVALACVVGFEGLWAVKQKVIVQLYRAEGTLGHANSLSMYLCLATPPLIAVAYAGWTKWLRVLGGVAAAFGAMGVLMTVSRAGIPVFAVVAVGTFLACASWQFKLKVILLRAGLALAGVALVASLWSQLSDRFGGVTLEEEYLDANVDGRGIYLRLAKNIATDHFFGVGLNNWSYHVGRTYGPQLGFYFTDYDYLVSVYGTEDVDQVFGDSYLAAPAHNLAALTLGELGVPGLMIFLLLWGRWFSLGVRFLFRPRGDPMRTLGVGLFFSVCGIFGQSLTEWVFRQTPILFMFHILIGALASLVYTDTMRRREATARTAAPRMLPTLAAMPVRSALPAPELVTQESLPCA